MKTRYVSRQEALEKARKFCAYQERSHLEVWEKLKTLNQPHEMAEELLTELIEEGFLDEERFARAYVRGKFKNNRWGRLKIRQGLKTKGVQPRLIDKALEEIDEDDYQATLHHLLLKKLKQLKGESQVQQKNKVARYLTGKGYEQGLVWKIIDQVFSDLET